MAEKDKGTTQPKNANARAERKFDTMMDMMSQLLAKMNQSMTPIQQCQNTKTRTSNVNPNGRLSSQTIQVTRGSDPRPLQPTFTRKEEPPAEPKATIPMANEVRNSYMEYATLPAKIHEILSLDQFMNQKKKRGGGRYENCAPMPPRNFQQALGR